MCRAQGKRGEGRRKREGGREGSRCSQLRHKRPRTHQKGRARSYDERIQGHPRKKRGKKERKKEGRKERKKERERERERERKGEERKGKRQVFPATNKRPGTHQRKRGVILSISFRKTPESKERKGEGRGRRGFKFSTGSSGP